MSKTITCNKCKEEIQYIMYNMMPNGADTDTHLCNVCFEKYIKWLKTKD